MNPDPQRAILVDRLAYARELLSQLLLVATIFGGFSIGGVVALLVAPERDRLRGYLFLMLCASSLAFIFATSLDAVLLPAAKRPASERDAQVVAGLLQLAEVVAWSVIAGTACLWSAIAAFGFAFSRRLGILVLAIAVPVLFGFIALLVRLAILLG
jgi:hypothetical protein